MRNWEFQKPQPKRNGWNKPFISINAEGVINLSQSAAEMLDVKEGGYIGVAKNSQSGKYALVALDGRNGNSYQVSKNRRIKDITLPAKLRYAYDIKSDELGRIFLDPHRMTIDGKSAYQLMDE